MWDSSSTPKANVYIKDHGISGGYTKEVKSTASGYTPNDAAYPFKSELNSQGDKYFLNYHQAVSKYGLSEKKSDYLPPEQLTECIDAKDLVGRKEIPTGKFFYYINDEPLERKVLINAKEQDPLNWKTIRLNITVNQSAKHEVMKSEIYVNISEYKEETTIPILNIVTDECTEYSISSYFILPKNSAKSNESLWVQTEKNEKVLVKFGEQSFSEYKEGTIDFIAEYAEPKKKTEIIIKCLQDQCSTFKSRTISLDFKAEKIEYEMQKIAERKKLVEEEERKRAYQKKMEEHQRLFEIERKAIMKEQRKIDAANRLQEIRKLPINTLNEEERKVKINDAKKLCIDLGFAPKTAKLRECILELM